MNSASKNIAEQFWLADLGAKEFLLGVQVQSHALAVRNDLGSRAVCFVSGGRVFVTAPPEHVAELKAAFDHSNRDPADTFMTTMRAKGRIVGDGRAYVGYADSFDDSDIQLCKVSKDDERVQRLAEDYPDDWDVFGLTEHSAGPFASIFDGQLLGLSHYEIWGGVIAHIGVMTVPAARGRGVGEQVVRQAAHEALKSGLLPQYRTLWSNKPSIRLAEKLGFSHFADTVVVRCGEG